MLLVLIFWASEADEVRKSNIAKGLVELAFDGLLGYFPNLF
jgi:hypothetical protein